MSFHLVSEYTTIYLEEREEIVELLLLRSTIKAHAARIQQNADEANPEEVVRHINRARIPGQRMSLGCIQHKFL